MSRPSGSDFRSVDKENIIGQRVPLCIFCPRVNGTSRYDLVRGMTNLSLALEGWSKIARLHQLLYDVQPSNELTLDINLGEGGPVGEGLQTLPHLLICEDVEGGEGNLGFLKNRHKLLRKATFWLRWVALHKHHDRSLVGEAFQARLKRHLLGKHSLQLTRLHHLLDDVETANQLTFQVQLGVSRPVRVAFQALTNLFI